MLSEALQLDNGIIKQKVACYRGPHKKRQITHNDEEIARSRSKSNCVEIQCVIEAVLKRL